jgi:hypothetical protein
MVETVMKEPVVNFVVQLKLPVKLVGAAGSPPRPPRKFPARRGRWGSLGVGRW